MATGYNECGKIDQPRLVNRMCLRRFYVVRGDVARFTYQLFEKLRADTLMVPVRPPRDLPTSCPASGSKAELIPFHPDYEKVSKGQIWDYEIGQEFGAWGFARCTKAKFRKDFLLGYLTAE